MAIWKAMVFAYFVPMLFSPALFALAEPVNRTATSADSAASGSSTPNEQRTYYLSPSGSDSNSGLSGSPWATFSRAWAVLLPGDTLQVEGGIYSKASPPPGKSGTASKVITVRATNPGGAQIASLLTFKGNSYLAFIGFKINGTTQAVTVAGNGKGFPSHHLTFQQISWSCTAGILNDNGCFLLYDGTHHVLLEDSWGWGGGRYLLICQGGYNLNIGCDNNTFRRLVLRKDAAPSRAGNPQASLALYYSANNIVENVIALDGQAASNSSNAAFYVPTNVPPPNADSNKFYGVIALNNLGAGLYLDGAGISNFNEIRNSVFWGNSSYGLVLYNASTCNNTIYDHNTIGRAGANSGMVATNCLGTSLTNNAFYSNPAWGVILNSGSITTNSNNGYFGNGIAPRNGVSAGTGDLTSDPGFMYITRIEATSPYHGAGSSGSDIGANVINRYQDGTLTGTPLWPWPNEARARSEMCSVVVGNWCSSGKSLTKYVWEYLGNPSPY